MRDNLLRSFTFVVMLWWGTFLCAWVAYLAMLVALVWALVFGGGQLPELLFSAGLIWVTVIAGLISDKVREAHDEVWSTWDMDA